MNNNEEEPKPTRLWRYVIPFMNVFVALLFLWSVHLAFDYSLKWASPSIDGAFWADIIVYGFVIYMILFQNKAYIKRYWLTITGNKVVIVENRITLVGLMPKFRELQTGFHLLWWGEHTHSRDGKDTKNEIDLGNIVAKVTNDDGFQLKYGEIAIPTDMVLVFRVDNPTLFAIKFKIKDVLLRFQSEVETFLREEFRKASNHDDLRAVTDWGGKFKKFLINSSTVEKEMGVKVEDFSIGDIDESVIEQKARSSGIAARTVADSVAKCYRAYTGRDLSADLSPGRTLSETALRIAQEAVEGQTVDYRKIVTSSGKGTIIELNEGK